MTTLDRINDVFQQVFDDDQLVVGRGTAARDVSGWDSMTHVGLLLQVEKSFQLRFSSAEVGSLLTVGELVDLIERKVTEIQPN